MRCYSSLNFKDAMSASGNKRISQNFPHTPRIGAASVGLAASLDIAMSVNPFITRGISLLGVDSVYIQL